MIAITDLTQGYYWARRRDGFNGSWMPVDVAIATYPDSEDPEKEHLVISNLYGDLDEELDESSWEFHSRLEAPRREV